MSDAGVFYNKNSLSICASYLSLSSAILFFNVCVDTSCRKFMIKCLEIIIYAVSFILGVTLVVKARSIAQDVLVIFFCSFEILIGIAILARIRKLLLRFTIVITIASAVIFSITLYFNWDYFLELAHKERTLTGRTLLWEWADVIIAQRPILGVGYQAFWLQGNPLAEALWEMEHIGSRTGFHFHNVILEIGVELGLLGAAICVASIAAALIVTLRSLMWNPTLSALFAFSVIGMIAVAEQQGVNLFYPFSGTFYLFVSVYLYTRYALSRRSSLALAHGGRNRPRKVSEYLQEARPKTARSLG